MIAAGPAEAGVSWTELSPNLIALAPTLALLQWGMLHRHSIFQLDALSSIGARRSARFLVHLRHAKQAGRSRQPASLGAQKPGEHVRGWGWGVGGVTCDMRGLTENTGCQDVHAR